MSKWSRDSDTMKNNKWEKLENSMKQHLDHESLIFLHPGDERNYTDEEMVAFNSQRSFETRLYFTIRPSGGDSGKY